MSQKNAFTLSLSLQLIELLPPSRLRYYPREEGVSHCSIAAAEVVVEAGVTSGFACGPVQARVLRLVADCVYSEKRGPEEWGQFLHFDTTPHNELPSQQHDLALTGTLFQPLLTSLLTPLLETGLLRGTA